MDSEAQATIARVYSRFQNKCRIKPKIIPFGNKKITDYKKDRIEYEPPESPKCHCGRDYSDRGFSSYCWCR